MEMQIDKNVTYAIIGVLICTIGYISYNWMSWATETLITVDKRTEVMSVQIGYIVDGMGLNYGLFTQND